MPIPPGTRLGPYEILEPLGAGGMGEVYRARDTRLDRTVAIKVLPQELAKDELLRQRLEREARTASSLNHPHICALYDIGHQDGAEFLVMEFLEGETLAARVERGALPWREAMRVAMEIADALDKAHRQGVVHRDLKPGNIMLTKSGAKLMDFGLAKAGPQFATARASLSTSPTVSVPLASAGTRNLTAQGTIVGTFQYMSPEQVEGREADSRSDIFAFGAVLFEMVTGRKAFEGKSAVSLIAAILDSEPPAISALAPLTPAALDRLVKTCVAKDPDDRWQTMRDVLHELKWIAESGSQAGISAAAMPPSKSRAWLRMLPWAGMAMALAVAGISVWWPAPKTGSHVVRFAVRLPAGMIPALGYRPNVAISPDGQQLAFVPSQGGQQQIYTRRIDSLEIAPVAGTDLASSPFFSPDGQWVGFVADGKFKKIRLGGGTPIILADAPDSRGAAWLADDTIVFSPGPIGGLWRASAAGGAPQELTKLQDSKNERTHRWPFALPGGRAVLFTVGTRDSAEDYDDAEIEAVVVATGERRQILKGARMAQFIEATGHLVYAREGSLFAVSFDAARLTTRGKPIQVLQGVFGEKTTGASYFAISSTGNLFFLPGAEETADRALAWLDPTGKPQMLPAPQRQYLEPALSPDGQRVAVDITAGRNTDVWVYDLNRNALNRLTFGPSNYAPTWSADSRRVFYRKDMSDGKFAIAWKSADGMGEEEVLLVEDRPVFPSSASPDGKWLGLSLKDPKNQFDLYMLPLSGDRKPLPYVTGPFDETGAVFSPDGRWVAYESNETGRYETFVKPFPFSSGRWQISTDGGSEARWSPRGKELIVKFGSRYTAVPVETADTFRAGTPRLYLDSGLAPINASSGSSFCLSLDGKRILTAYRPKSESSPLELVVAANWVEELLRATSPQK